MSFVDEYTRQVHCLHLGRHIGSKAVHEVTEKMIDKYGAPVFIRSGIGPEFIGRSLGEWLKEQGIKTFYIDPGSPWQKGMSKVSTANSRENAWGVKFTIHPTNAGL